MLIFLLHLVKLLDVERPGWRNDTVIQLDGARYYTGSKVREYMRKLELQVIYSAPYSYSTAPIEMVFGALKCGELNTEEQKTGKKVSDRPSISFADCAVFTFSRGHDWPQTSIDSARKICEVLARHDSKPFQVPLL